MKKNQLAGALVAECIGTMLILIFGCGVCAMTVLFGKGSPSETWYGGYTNCCMAWGIGVAMAVYVTAKVSGAHLNPAVTVAFALYRGFPWRKVAWYCLAQTAGAFLAAAIIYVNYRPALLRYDPGLTRTAGIFTTFPAFAEIPQAGLCDQIIGTGVLLLLICALTDEDNQFAGNLTPALIGLAVTGIGISLGGMMGWPLNPARDFGARLFVVMAGFRNNGLTDGAPVFWVPIVGPTIGGVLGAALYQKGIRPFLPAGQMASNPVEAGQTPGRGHARLE
jgi:glycerol uptake facilitator protein